MPVQVSQYGVITLLKRILLSSCFIAAAAQAETGVNEQAILLGQTVGVTGQIAGPVKEMQVGAQAYFNHVNRQGGVHGRKIELRVLDDRFDPVQAGKNAEILIKQEQVFALFQSRGTPHTQAILPLLTEHKIPLIAPSTGAALLHTPVQRYVFNVRARYQDEVKKGIEQFSTIGIKEIALAHVDDSFGKDGLAGFQAGLQLHGLQAAGIFSFDRVKPEVAKLIENIAASKGKALIIVGSAQTTAEIIRGLRAAGSTIQIMTLSNNAAQSFIDALDKHAIGIMVTQIVPAPHLLSSELGQEFKKLAKEAGAPESYAAMEGFVSAKVMVEGLRRAGRNLSREGLIRALEGMKKYDLGGVVLDYSERDHSGSEFVELTLIGRDRRFIR